MLARGNGSIEPFFHRENITIYHGDCREFLPTFLSESVDFVLTDPPYLVGYTGRWDFGHELIRGDDESSWLLPAYRELHRVLKPDAFLVTFYGWPHADLFVGTFKALGFRIISHLAFVKNVWGLGRFTRGQHETAFLPAKGKPPIPKAGISDVFEWIREPDAVHPNQKPLGAMRKVLATYAPAGGPVLDPFMGSGPVLRAAKDLGMPAIGIDCEEQWCRYAAVRLAQEVLFT